jgi:hypothetical protein
MSCFLSLIRISPSRLDGNNACCAAGCCILPGIAASLVVVPLGEEHDWRFSFCCARDGCRTRRTPPSFRFLGRKVYLAAMVVLIAIMREGATAARMRQLSALVGVSRRTVERWRGWWRDTFTASPFWQIGRATFMPPVDQDRLPASLIERFTGSGAERLIALLRFIAPIAGGDRHAR